MNPNFRVGEMVVVREDPDLIFPGMKVMVIQFYYAGIRSNPIALTVKLADIADNMDEARLAKLDNKTAARLRRKYAKALEALA